MESKNAVICCGCLHSGRKMIIVSDYWYKQCFLQIINETQVFDPDSAPLSLCWECVAQLRRSSTFKTQVKHSYSAFKEHVKQGTNPQELLIKETKPKYSLCKLFTITLDSSYSKEDYEVILPESYQDHSSIDNSEETQFDTCENGEQNDENEDEKFLINDDDVKLARNKKKKKKSVYRMQIEYEVVDLSRKEVLEERQLAMQEDSFVNAMFKCETCILCFANGDDLKDHVALKHSSVSPELDWRCDICECVCRSEFSFNYHTRKHSRRYQCVACTARFYSKGAAGKHYENTHCTSFVKWRTDYDLQSAEMTCDKTDNTINNTEPMFPCTLCDKSFRWKTSLRKHTETHRIENGEKRKPYCEPCRVSFSTTANLQKHLKTSSKHQIKLKLWKLKGSASSEAQAASISRAEHRARARHACSQCGARFQWPGNLTRHLQSHSARAKGDLVCKPCNKTFSSLATYKQHMAISKKHVSEKDFKFMCSHCGKKFANKTMLRDHINWEHLKSFVHTCKTCQKPFKSHTSLYLHTQVVHQKDSVDHLCHQCGKPFPNHAKLKTHMRAVHSGEASFECAICGAKFSWASCLSRHVRRQHKKPVDK